MVVRSSLALAVLVVGIAGCGGTSWPIDGSEAGSSEDTGPSTSTTPPPSDGSAPSDPSAPADESTGRDEPPDGTTDWTSGGPDDDATSGPPADDTTTGSNGAVGWCAYTCTLDAECPPQEGLIPLIACIDGFCQYGEPPVCDASLCPSELGWTCSVVDGLSFCVLACTPAGDECSTQPMFACTGVDDFGDSFCEPWPCWGAPEGGPCSIPGVGNFGICANGECVCNEDAQCTIAGSACNT